MRDRVWHAAVTGRTEDIKLLSLEGADLSEVHSRSKKKWTPLHKVAAEVDAVEVCEALVKYGADVNAKDTDGQTPLHFASELGKDSFISAMAASKHFQLDPNMRDIKGRTPLFRAVEAKLDVTVLALLSIRADPSIPNYDMVSPLHLASREGNLSLISLLIGEGADANSKDLDGKLPSDYTDDMTVKKVLAEASKLKEELSSAKKLGEFIGKQTNEILARHELAARAQAEEAAANAIAGLKEERERREDAERRLASHKLQAEAAIAKAARLEVRTNEAEMERSTAEDKVLMMGDELVELKKRIEQMERQHIADEKKIDELQMIATKATSVKSEVENAPADLQRANERIKALEFDMADLKTQLAEEKFQRTLDKEAYTIVLRVLREQNEGEADMAEEEVSWGMCGRTFLTGTFPTLSLSARVQPGKNMKFFTCYIFTPFTVSHMLLCMQVRQARVTATQDHRK
uniref:Uncharacterized protein n=1 Tax=Palpitomonas bilix TaxID=652834 RepID=A0A7S3DE10_9EUKA|mmetsp:Transcript_33652/g.86227  ORF Transcript_33652/g.86227 Transcript_33652/m.86227 type:complete len:462 (+) Transcript_33652:387-1772(+)